MKKILLGLILFSMISACNNSETSGRWQNVDIAVYYMDSVKVDTLHLHLPLGSSGAPYTFDLYGDRLPYICLGYERVYIACNVRTYHIIKNTHN